MFSPYYAWSRSRGGGAADPLAHCAINVALYRIGAKRWAMTERPAANVERDATHLRIGPSALEWRGDALTATIEEWSTPLPRRVRGRIDVWPQAFSRERVALDPRGEHHWCPIAPCSRIQVWMEKPALRWSGHAYVDSNFGSAPLETAFTGWDWSRARMANGDTAVLYDVERKGGSRHAFGMRFGTRGTVESFEPPMRQPLRRTAWGLDRSTHSEPGDPPCAIRSLEDTPFYARSLVAASLLGEPVAAFHERLSVDRFASTWVRCLLPFRMPRRRY